MEIKTKVQVNTYKTTAEADKKKPDFTGITTIENNTHQVAVWKNEDGSLYLQIKPKESR